MLTLLNLTEGTTGTIIKVRGGGAFRRRITEMGFVKGKEVTVIKSAPLQDPIEYRIMGYNLSLRQSEARLIEVISREQPGEAALAGGTNGSYQGTLREDSKREIHNDRGKTIDIALVGNPNCGKTTLFNVLSGSHERVGNFSGVTVDAKASTISWGKYTFNITDLPGTYSLSAYSPEELFVRNHIINAVPDIVVNVVDGSNLERNLYLTTQLIDMDIRVVMALNMHDEMEKKGDLLDHFALGQLLGIPIIPTVGSKGTGIDELLGQLVEVFEDRNPVIRHVHINYGTDIEKAIRHIQEDIRKDPDLAYKISTRYFSIKLLEKDQDVAEIIRSSINADAILKSTEKEINLMESGYREDSATLMTDAKYGFIAGALKETMKRPDTIANRKELSDRIDTFLTHRYLGYPIFLLFLWIMFQTTFSIGAYPKHWIELGVGWIGNTTGSIIPGGPLRDLLVDGIINGVGSVIVFLPNILILFLFISLMEDTGYMARAAFIMDKLMHKMGLHGQSFIPLIMGFGCNVPAIMVTRTLRDRNDRLLTMLINPFMSCSARLPVYILIAGAVFGKQAGTVIFGLYLTGIILAVLISLLFKKTLFKSKEAPFVMELPPYRMPTAQVILRHMWEKGQQYLRKMGGIILLAVILIWALEYFPAGSGVKPDERLKQSYISRIGKFVEPVIRPLGFDWKMGVSLLTGAAAKEVVVSTMGVLYGSNHFHEAEKTKDLTAVLRSETHKTGPKAGERVFTPLVGISFLVFILIYMPCVAVMATVKRESGHWKWPLFLMVYTTTLAWLMSFAIYQIGSIFIL
ncbi:MAG: ferrous iron transport protein B [bacterium]